MPYITREQRDRLAREVELSDDGLISPTSPGELNYVITRLIHNYLYGRGIGYQHFNDAIGALESAKLELYRRFVVPYEDKKIAENGDVSL